MTACAKCGHDPSARVLRSWTFDIPRSIRSLNEHRVNVHGWQGAVYKRERTKWVADLIASAHVNRLSEATVMRRVTITRVMGRGQRVYDADNLRGGGKMLVDAMVLAGMLVDDDAKHAEVHYEQIRGSAPATQFLIEELEQ